MTTYMYPFKVHIHVLYFTDAVARTLRYQLDTSQYLPITKGTYFGVQLSNTDTAVIPPPILGSCALSNLNSTVGSYVCFSPGNRTIIHCTEDYQLPNQEHLNMRINAVISKQMRKFSD